ncbi:hypothetical protein OAN81_08445 [Paracoccaceae bacterium]|nr:hypothetical protein [Paracoccaceae bacterium]
MQNPYALMDRPQIQSETLDKIRQAIMTDQRPQSLEERIEAPSEAEKTQLMRSVKMDQLSMQIHRVIDPYITYYEMLEQMYPKLRPTVFKLRAEVMESIDPAPEMSDEIRLKREAERKSKADAHQKTINDMLDSYARPFVADDDIAEFKAETKLSANDMRLATIAADNRRKANKEKAQLSFIDQLTQNESSGQSDAEITIKDGRRFVGSLQFGEARLKDYQKATGSSFSQDDFKADTALQDKVADWHIKDIDKAIDALGINTDGYDRDGLRAVAHLGGKGGMKKFVLSKGEYDPSDDLGTSLKQYYDKFRG